MERFAKKNLYSKMNFDSSAQVQHRESDLIEGHVHACFWGVSNYKRPTAGYKLGIQL